MIKEIVVTSDEVNRLYEKLEREAEASGYHLNPNVEFAKELVKGLCINEKRYGYWACPCRLASRKKEADLDIICPCDYRDPDLNDYDTCYCALYVSRAAVDSEKKISAVPERRLPTKERKKPTPKTIKGDIASLSLPVWRCKVCGYLCARKGPPEVCPICRVKKERFECFI